VQRITVWAPFTHQGCARLILTKITGYMTIAMCGEGEGGGLNKRNLTELRKICYGLSIFLNYKCIPADGKFIVFPQRFEVADNRLSSCLHTLCHI